MVPPSYLKVSFLHAESNFLRPEELGERLGAPALPSGSPSLLHSTPIEERKLTPSGLSSSQEGNQSGGEANEGRRFGHGQDVSH